MIQLVMKKNQFEPILGIKVWSFLVERKAAKDDSSSSSSDEEEERKDEKEKDDDSEEEGEKHPVQAPVAQVVKMDSKFL